MSMHSQIWPVVVVAAGLAFAGASQATQSTDLAESHLRSHTGMMDMPSMAGMNDMMGMMSMMDGCARMMQMPQQPHSAPNQQWRQNRSLQPQSR